MGSNSFAHSAYTLNPHRVAQAAHTHECSDCDSDPSQCAIAWPVLPCLQGIPPGMPSGKQIYLLMSCYMCLGVRFEQHVLPCMQCCAHHASVFHHTLLLAAQAVVFSTPESVGPGRKIRSTSQRMQCSAHSILLSYMALFS